MSWLEFDSDSLPTQLPERVSQNSRVPTLQSVSDVHMSGCASIAKRSAWDNFIKKKKICTLDEDIQKLQKYLKLKVN